LYELFSVPKPKLDGERTKLTFLTDCIKHGKFNDFANAVLDVLVALNSGTAHNMRGYVRMSNKDEPITHKKFAGGRGRTIKEPPWYVAIAQIMLTATCKLDQPELGEPTLISTPNGLQLSPAYKIYTTDDIMAERPSKYWLLGHDIQHCLKAWKINSLRRAMQDWVMADVSAWDKTLHPRLVQALFVGLTGSQAGLALARWCHLDPVLVMYGRCFENPRPSWASGNSHTLSGNTIIHAAIVGTVAEEYLVQGDDVIVQAHKWKRLHAVYNQLGMTVKEAMVGEASLEFCKIFVLRNGMQGIDLSDIARKAHLKTGKLDITTLEDLCRGCDYVIYRPIDGEGGTEINDAVKQLAQRTQVEVLLEHPGGPHFKKLDLE
jgi:hypothetical protein